MSHIVKFPRPVRGKNPRSPASFTNRDIAICHIGESKFFQNLAQKTRSDFLSVDRGKTRSDLLSEQRGKTRSDLLSGQTQKTRPDFLSAQGIEIRMGLLSAL
ncbi:MAG: hypothetical protein JJ866_15860 [Roseibium sp.]|uniref:hypothetical protein n=1 Tax=Roseibium sp. TaxID=1936156 RepID=UPI001B2B5B5E|nr:hypothetical protein [Roseibium sp.]MBO6893419.1 hypothetical protein [Roseibium sp.]MBO6930614.1 hypothetical protein [Roseibium sp.]